MSNAKILGTIAKLAVAVSATVGCSSSEPARGLSGQSGHAAASGAGASGRAPLEAGGGNGFGGSSASAGNAPTPGAPLTAGSPASGGHAGSAGAISGGGAGNAGMSGGAGATSGGAAGSDSGGSGGAGAATSSCTPARPHTKGSSTVTLKLGGLDRTYLVHIPPSYDGIEPLPVVFDVHGYGSFASEQRTRSKWDQTADKEGFVLINPEGIDKSWNAGSCCGGNEQDDVGFFREIVEKATAELCIDPKRVYLSGHSNGGAMTYRLACEAADLFAAVAPVCGWMTINNCNPVRRVPVLAIRSLNDGTVTIDTADRDIDEWLSNDGCAKDQVTVSGVCKAYASCQGGAEVMDCRPRGNHDFFYGANPDSYLVPDEAWPFFKQFSLP